jgi:diguanylate cyclase (GGDEF)-like protein
VNTIEQMHPAILIVDDQPVNIQVLSKLLGTFCEILVATSGAKALEIATGLNIPSLILLDINMPDMDGYEVCRKLKENEQTKEIPVMFITARNDAEDEEKGFLLGASDYIIKPFKPVVVIARVRNQLNLRLRTELLEKIARTDGLTGISNRRTYDDELVRLFRHCARNGKPLSVLMIDVDHFKAYNDNYGHGAGDICLRQVAHSLNSLIRRPLEVVARYGGEEFAAILPETDAGGARHIAEGMLEAVRSLSIPHAFSSAAQYVTVSIGYAAMNCEENDACLEALGKEADRALYRAKRAGRNRAECADS